MRSKKVKNVEPENWNCSVCSKNFPAGNELTFHYMTHSILELAVALTNQQRLEKGLATEPIPEKAGASKPKTTENDADDIFASDDAHAEDDDDGDDDNGEADVVADTKVPERQVFSCRHCGKVLSSKGNLKKHEVIHSEVKPWHCGDCGFSFNRARDLKTHRMQKHSDERPHVCNICGKGFVHKSYLNEHLDYHSGDRKWQCSQCGKTFQSSSTLAKHVLRHRTDRQFLCHLCQKAFTVKIDLRSHIKLVHQKLGPTGIPIFPAKKLPKK